MKKFGWILCLGIGMLLSACGSASTPQTSPGSPASATPRPVATAGGEAPVDIQLLIGTLKLEGSKLAVMPDQAAVLLPLWREVQDILRRARRTEAADPAAAPVDAAARQQIDGLLERIKAAMTSDQLEAIARMQITQESAEIEGQQLLSAPTGHDGQTPRQGTRTGGPPDDGSGQGGGMELRLLWKIIRMLESRAGGTPTPE